MNIKAIAFDTGGTVLDWHSGVCAAFSRIGAVHGIQRNWHAITNEYRRRVMKGIVGQVRPTFNMDDLHRSCLDPLLAEQGLQAFAAQERWQIAHAWHELSVWPDVPRALARLRNFFPVISFTMLPLSLVLDVSRHNEIDWDAVISCEMIGVYKPNPEAYMKVANWLQLPPAEILMVACHNFDLNAARACGLKTAFVRRPQEWGPEGPPDPIPHADCNIVVDDFAALAQRVMP